MKPKSVSSNSIDPDMNPANDSISGSVQLGCLKNALLDSELSKSFPEGTIHLPDLESQLSEKTSGNRLYFSWMVWLEKI